MISAALHFEKSKVGVPYDGRYGLDDSVLYCSELIFDAFWFANGSKTFFEESSMSFSDPASGEVLEIWIGYHTIFGEEVPRGELGANPGNLSMSQKLGAYHQLGSLRGLAFCTWPTAAFGHLVIWSFGHLVSTLRSQPALQTFAATARIRKLQRPSLRTSSAFRKLCLKVCYRQGSWFREVHDLWLPANG